MLIVFSRKLKKNNHIIVTFTLTGKTYGSL